MDDEEWGTEFASGSGNSTVTFPPYQLEDPPYAAAPDFASGKLLYTTFVILVLSMFVLLLSILLACHFLRNGRGGPFRAIYSRRGCTVHRPSVRFEKLRGMV
ncbi:protein ORF6 [Lizard adenovirus 2]|uniref:Protein ORF6 n=1 Tax=Lizard adenovirus 2 TaxID=874272 RepID=A0A076FUN4_9ADEN|nr:protein ORF6 [Lizard adenovirus 2]AII22584.1 protein ORF6 [Lizard adenovirus 2]